MTEAPRLREFVGLEPVLSGWLSQERWFADKHRRVSEVQVQHAFWLRRQSPALAVVLVEVGFDDGPRAAYQLVLGLRPWDRHLQQAVRAVARRVPLERNTAAGASSSAWAIYDAFQDQVLGSEFIDALRESSTFEGDDGAQLRFRLLHPPLPPGSELKPTPTPPKDESQSTVLYGDQLMLKLLRRVWPGVSPEVELLEALDRSGFSGIARPVGVVEMCRGDAATSLGLFQSYLRNGTDGFSLALTSLRDLYGDLVIDADGAVPLPQDCRLAVERQGASFASSAAQIGTLTAEMHLALSRLEGRPELEARPLTAEDLEFVAQDLTSFLERLLGLEDPRLEPLAVHAEQLRSLARAVAGLEPSGMAIRVHGDFHLGQLLRTDAGWHTLDFEGRPALPIEVRQRKTTALQDVAGMLRSFDYAASVALRQQADETAVSASSLAPYGRAWSALAREIFVAEYSSLVESSGLVPAKPEDTETLLTCLQASQALYEVDYELRSRPEWVSIPLEGIARLLNAEATDD